MRSETSRSRRDFLSPEIFRAHRRVPARCDHLSESPASPRVQDLPANLLSNFRVSIETASLSKHRQQTNPALHRAPSDILRSRKSNHRHANLQLQYATL